MADLLRFTIVGSGSSPGVPRPNGDWGNCDPSNPKNKRRRPAALVERIRPDGRTTRVAIDTGPDFREQMISAAATHLDAVVYTHGHADHIHGIDDVRSYFLEARKRIDIFADAMTLSRLRAGFEYCFETPPGSSYPPIVEPHLIDHDTAFEVEGPGGPISFLPLPQIHGDMMSLGFRIGNLAYCSDVSDYPSETVPLLENLELLVIDSLQYRPHPSHFSLGEALEWIDRLKPRQAVLTHMHVPLDYETVRAETPDNVEPAFDGMVFEFPLKAD